MTRIITYPINKDIDTTWKMLAHRYSEVGEWARTVSHSSGTVKKDELVKVGDARSCNTSFGNTTEKVLAVDKASTSMSFDIVAEKLPSFITDIRHTWTVVKKGENESELRIKMDMDMKKPHVYIFGPIMNKRFGKKLTELASDFAAYVEADGNGVSEAKKKAQSKK